MCEDLQQLQNKDHWRLPQRVQLTVKGWLFCLCAYQFHDETEQVSKFGANISKLCSCYRICVNVCVK